MTLREKQSIFAKNVAKLILHAYEKGYEITLGEAQRTNEQQLLYYFGFTLVAEDGTIKLRRYKKRSKTLNSRHLLRLAIDLYLFKNGKFLKDKESYKFLADYWKSLHPDNVAGYDWGWDANHFEMKP
jgi:hypothetical protein